VTILIRISQYIVVVIFLHMCCDIVTVSVDVVTFEFVLLLYHIINSILFTAVEADLYECFKSEEN
jgi:hypothetical protein